MSKTKFSSQVIKDLNGFLSWIKPEDLFRSIQSVLLISRSKTETKYLDFGTDFIEQDTGQKVVFSGYEWMSLKLPGAKYTPDWFYLLDNGQMVFVEVKASKHAKGYRDSRSKLRAAATLNPWAVFYEVRHERGKWTVERIKPDEKFLRNFTSLYEDEP